MRPPGYEPGELPTAPLRDVTISNRIGVTKISIAGAKVRLLVETTKLRNEIMKDLTVFNTFILATVANPQHFVTNRIQNQDYTYI